MARDVKLQITAHDKTAAAFNSLNKKLGGLNKSIGASVTKIAKIGAAFAAAGVASAAALTKASMTNIDSLAKTADKIGATTEALSGLRHAAELTGVGSDTLDMAMQRLTRRVSEAANGTGEAKDALIELGIPAASLEKLPLDKQMEVIADAMNGVKSQSDKVRLAMKLFDSEGVSLVNTLAGGSNGLQEMAAEADHLGVSISRVDAAQIELANDAVTRAKAVFTGLGNQLGKAFSPIIDGVATKFYQSALDAEGFGHIGQDVAQALVNGFGYVLDTVQMVQHGILGLELVALKAKKALQNAFEPDAAAKAWQKEYYEQLALRNKGEISQRQFTEWQIKSQKQVAEGTYVVNGAIKSGSEETQAAIDEIIAKMAEFTNSALPSDKITLLYKRIVAESEAAAVAIADNSPAKVMLDDANKNGGALLEKLTFLQEQAAAGEKKRKEFEMQSATAQTSHVLGELSNQFSGIAQNNKKLFQLNKAFQIAQAVMQTYQGATLALSSYPPPLSFVMAGAQVAAGLGQVAQIRAQSFEGGGFTGRGARAGGLDGKGGQMHMLHPNETVIDHTKGQAGGITIVNNIDATGAGADVDMKIRAAMQQTSQQTIMSIQDLMRRRRFV